MNNELESKAYKVDDSTILSTQRKIAQPQDLETLRIKPTCYSEVSPKVIHDKKGNTDEFKIRPHQIEIEEKVIEEFKKVDSKKILGTKKNNFTEFNQLAANNCLKLDNSDQERLKKIKQSEKSSTLKRPGKFWSIVVWICLCQFTVG